MPPSPAADKPANEPYTTSLPISPAASVSVPAADAEVAATTSAVVNRAPKTSWRDRAYGAVAGDHAPTWSLDLRAIQEGIDEQKARGVIDLAMRIAESLLSTGASAAEVTASVLRITAVFSLRSVHVDVTFTSISVCHYRGAEAPITAMRTVRARSADFERLARLQQLVDDIEDSATPDLARAREVFTDIVGMRRVYRRSFVTFASAMLAMSVCIQLGGSLIEVLLSLINAIVVDRTQLWLARRRLPTFFTQMVGGMIPTAVAVALIYARSQSVPGLADVSASVVVATGIVVMLAGLSVVGAAQDAIDGYYLTAGARAFEVVVLTLGIVVGILAVLGVSQAFGAPLELLPYTGLAGNLPVEVAASALIAGSFALSSYAGANTALVSLATGSLGWVVYSVVSASGLGTPAASGIAALAVGLCAQVLSRWARVPALALSTAGIVPLLPGLTTYTGLFLLATREAGDYGPAFDALSSAMSIGLALAAGVSLGGYLGRVAQRDGGRVADRARERSLRRAHADARE